MRTASSLVPLLLASACASLDRNECLHADWYAIGLEDGARAKAALKDGIPYPRIRAGEVERLEALTREAEQLETRIQEAERR